MVYDITDDESFKEIENWKNKFMQQANVENPRKYPFLLLGNKADRSNSDRKVNLNEGEMYAKNNHMEFFETSATNGQNIEKAFNQIASIAADSDTVPFFTEELVERIEMEEDNPRPGNGRRYQDRGQGGCACELL